MSTGPRSCDPNTPLDNLVQAKSQGACKWTAAGGIGPSGCYSGTGICANDQEKAANYASTGPRSCNPLHVGPL